MKQLFLLITVMMTMVARGQTFRFNEVTYSPEQTVFRLFAPKDAKRVVVRLYRDGQGGRALKTIRMQRSDELDPAVNEAQGCLWTATVPGNLMGRFYTFDMGKGECPGVFAKAVGVNGKRGAIIDWAATNPEGWAEDKRPLVKRGVDHVIYELHHRDFSISRPGASNPGKFLALTEPWAIDHLKTLGVNAVHILPSYDFGSVDETRLDEPQYNWGYDPVNYNVPEGSYATDPYRPEVRIREFKTMVQALHRAGIRVILDVVYNHTYDLEHSNFQRTFPDYFYRKQDGTYSNGSGCGNETASERPMMRQFMLESIRYWIEEYHIDGFRFDLMGIHDIETMNAIRQLADGIDPTLLIYGEGWSAGACALPEAQRGVKANVPQMPGIAAFSDELRDALRGPFSDDTKPGWLWGAPNLEESLKYGIVGGISHPQVKLSEVNYTSEPWTLEPGQLIAYVSCHDDMCLTDRLRASRPKVKKNDSAVMQLDLLAQTAVMLSQGVPFMLSGEELLRTKQGVHNSFQSPDSINQLNWDNKERYGAVFDYYCRLIALRKHHPAFRLGSADLVRKHLEFLEMPKGVVAYRLKNYAGLDAWRNIIVVLNANEKATQVTVPAGHYTVVCRDGRIDEKGLGSLEGGRITAGGRSALIIHD